MKLALYDMDRTITREPSWLPWLLFWARTEAPWRLLLLPLVAVPLVLYPALGRKGVKQVMQWLLMGASVPEARVAARAQQFAADFGARAERQDALARIAADRAEGHDVVLVTASSRYYVEALAQRWGIAHVIATENVRDGGAITHRIAGENCYGGEKVARLHAWLAGRVPASVRAYSDHASDAPLLELADEPVAVSPSAALSRVAAARGWKQVIWS
ncbi:HAD family hydrolase [Thermaurantiacus sp.]